MLDIDELKRLANEAGGKQWKYTGEHIDVHGGHYQEILDRSGGVICGEVTVPSEEEAQFIAAANPSAILELIERLERASWIDVSERLPTTPGMKLVFVPTMDDEKPYIGMAWFEPAGTGNMEGWQLLPASYCGAITHWTEPLWPSAHPKPASDDTSA